MSNLSPFIKYHRKRLGFTQEDLALKAGVGIRFIRELEQGKKTLQLDKVELVLSLFGFELAPAKQQLDPYDIFSNFLLKAVKITLKNKVIKYGMIVNEIFDFKENKITAWEFVSNMNMIKYHQKTDDQIIEKIAQSDIQQVEEQ
jgi:y4mF family transcriptional regulator